MDSDRQCTATSKQSGERCKRWAIPGGTTCKIHGSGTGRAKAAAARRLEQEAAARAVALFGAPKDVEPAQALLDLVHWTAGEVEFWRERVRALAAEDEAALTWGKTGHELGSGPQGRIDKTTHEAKPNIAYVMLYAAQDRLAQYATAALKAGVSERQVRLQEQQGSLVSEALRRILGSLIDALLAAGMDQALRTHWDAAVAMIVPRELRAIAAGGTA